MPSRLHRTDGPLAARGLPGLKNFTLPPDAKDIEFLRTDPKLERLGTNDAKTGGGLPDQRPRLSGSTGSTSVTGTGGTVGTEMS